jgi:pyruvate kinase
VQMLGRIAAAAEPLVQPRFGPAWQEPRAEHADDQQLIAASLAHMAERTSPLGILVPTATGATARRIAAFRLQAWITAVSPSERACQQMQFVHGVDAVHLPERPPAWGDFIRDHYRDRGPGRVLMTAGGAAAGGTNRLEIVNL